ncbi:MAG: hypothetical protein Q7S74_03170 [Nanoarchaeota archaeon]|nr:hypothetical protein [Nanoarchaeota archaeon]
MFKRGLAPIFIGIIVFIVAVGAVTIYYAVSSPNGVSLSPGINNPNCVKADLVGGMNLTPNGQVTNSDVLYVKSKFDSGCNTAVDAECTRADINGNGQVTNSDVLLEKSIYTSGNCTITPPSCYDKDEGISGASLFNRTTVYGVDANNIGYKFSDYCMSATSINESGCNSISQYISLQTSCPSNYTCNNGACMPLGLTGLYDDFSSGFLDSTKWIESTFHGDPFTDEHFVNISEEAYHIEQNIEGDRETNLEPTRLFNAGDSFYYEVVYKGGSGNHQSQPLINGNYPPSQIESCNYPIAGCGAIGYMNDFPDLGAQIGTYRINFEFFHNQVKMTTIRPDNVNIINTFTGNSEPYKLTINTHTGHNGLMHFDLDNFYINRTLAA